jgi:hypothetical protein
MDIFYTLFLTKTHNPSKWNKIVQALILSLIGNPVKVGDGPAAVIGDEHRIIPLFQEKGMGRRGK